MRILVAHPGPEFSVQDVYTGWVEALRQLGQEVAEYNLSDRLTFYNSALIEIEPGKMKRALDQESALRMAVNGLYSDLYRGHPDVLLVISGFFLPVELYQVARAYGTRVVLIHTESPYQDGQQLVLAPHVDLNLVNDPTNLAQFQSIGPAEYVPHAYRPSVHRPGKPHPDLDCDFAFVGTGFQSRVDFFEAMDFGALDVVLAGNWQALPEGSPLHKYIGHDADLCIDNADTAELYRSMSVGLNLYRVEAENEEMSHGWAMGPREVEMAACGAFFLRDSRGEGDKLFPMLPKFRGPDDATELVHAYVGREDERKRLGELARLAVEERTFLNHAKRLLQRLDRQPATA